MSRTYRINKPAKMPPLRKNTETEPTSRGGDPPAGFAAMSGQWKFATCRMKGSNWSEHSLKGM